jgi:hypothetical protein
LGTGKYLGVHYEINKLGKAKRIIISGIGITDRMTIPLEGRSAREKVKEVVDSLRLRQQAHN